MTESSSYLPGHRERHPSSFLTVSWNMTQRADLTVRSSCHSLEERPQLCVGMAGYVPRQAALPQANIRPDVAFRTYTPLPQT